MEQRLEIAGDGFEFGAVRVRTVAIKTVIHVVMDKKLLCIGNSTLNCVKLLRHIETGTAMLDHADDRAQMPVGTFEPGDDGRMACMNMRL
ncbi:hypothetical protein GCM10011587_00550 [Pyruvatibacter mobilis]|nr:hypothetical protein GCM10011587_00550 [Pyruvatibacter mobilis]